MKIWSLSASQLLGTAGLVLVLVFQSCATVAPPVVEEPQAPIQKQKPSKTVVKSGLEVFLEMDHSGDSQKYALLANQTCVDRNLVHGVELLPKVIDLRLILSPEHGLFGAEDAGDKIGDEVDPATGIRSVTTYRRSQEDVNEMVSDVDVILFDIQDIGVRSYTYVYSMSYIMKAAAATGKKVIVLDRPNPVNGVQMEGNILLPENASGVGQYPIPYRHGMTTGELARLFNKEYDINCELEVVPLEGWTRDMWFEDTGLPWVPTSPHVPDASTIMPMISTGTYGELHVLSEGVGITIPFEFAGGPWIKNPNEFAAALKARIPDGVIFRPTFVKPYYGRFKGQVCGGVQIHVTDPDIYNAYLAGLLIMSTHMELYPEIDLFENTNRLGMFTKVMGDKQIELDLKAGKDPLDMQAGWMDALNAFAELRKAYLLYD